MKSARESGGWGDSSLDETYHYEAEKRSTVEGIILAALGGDREDLKRFAGVASVAIESSNEELKSKVLPWLIYVLDRIKGGEEPNKVFGWSRKRPGAPAPSQDMDGLRKQWLVGRHMQGLVVGETSQRKAAKEVATQLNVSEAEAIRCFKRMGDK